MDFPKPTMRPSNEDEASKAREVVLSHLRVACVDGAQELQATTVSVVMIGFGIWAAELAELNPRAASKLLRSLATIYDPASSKNQKAVAEKRRQDAVSKLFLAVDLDMQQPKGSA